MPRATQPRAKRRPKRIAVGFVAETFKHLKGHLQFDSEGNAYTYRNGAVASRIKYQRYMMIVEERGHLRVTASADYEELERQRDAIFDPGRVPYLRGRVSLVDLKNGVVKHEQRNATPTPPRVADQPLEQIHSAMAAIHFAMRLEEAVRRGTVRSEMFGHSFEIVDGPRTYLLPREDFTAAHMAGIAHNSVIHSTAAALVCADELLRKGTAARKRAGQVVPSEHEEIALAIFYLRNAYAHQSGGPTWSELRTRKRPRPITIALSGGISFTIDITRCAGQAVRPSQHAGVTGIMALLGYVADFVTPTP